MKKDFFAKNPFDELFDLGYETTMEKIVTVDNETKLFISLPGVPKDKINVSIENHRLIVEYNMEDDVASTAMFSPLRYSKKWDINSKVLDQEKVKSVMKNGVLEITFAAKEEVQPKRFSIDVL